MLGIAIQNLQSENISKRELELRGGTPVTRGYLEAIGYIDDPSIEGIECSATLIAHDIVLTAAHCVCQPGHRQLCDDIAIFTLPDVQPVGGWPRKDISIVGDVHVHPDYDGRLECLDRENVDLATIHLDISVREVAQVTPIPLEFSLDIPVEGDPLTLVGYGLEGSTIDVGSKKECSEPSGRKRQLTLPLDDIHWTSMAFRSDASSVTCGGDSGGPVLNNRLRVVGVASCSNRDDHSLFEP